MFVLLKNLSDRWDVAFAETDGSWRSSGRNIAKFVISGFHREADKNCALLCFYALSSGNLLPTFREDVTDWLSRNVCTELRLFAA